MSSMDVKNSDTLPQALILPKKKTLVPGLVRARFSKARPNVRPLAKKTSSNPLLKQENIKTAQHQATCKGPSTNWPLNISLEEKNEHDSPSSVKGQEDASSSKATQHEDAYKGPLSSLPLNISLVEENEQDSTPGVKDVEGVLLSSKIKPEDVCKSPSANLPLIISLEETDEQNSICIVENLEAAPLSKSKHGGICKSPSANLPLNISLEETDEQNLICIVENLEAVPLSKTKHDGICKSPSANLPLNISLEEANEQNSICIIENLEAVPLSKLKQSEDTCKDSSLNLPLNTSLEKEHEEDSTPSVNKLEDVPVRSKRHYEAAFEKESIATVSETPDSSTENVVSHSKIISEKTSKPRKKFANLCLTSPGSENLANCAPELNNVNDRISVHDSASEECIDDPLFCVNDKNITDQCSDNNEVKMDEDDLPTVLNDTESVPSKNASKSTSKNASKSSKKNVSKSSRKNVAPKKTRERKKRAHKAKEPPPRSQMTMIDLINYIPDGAPMKYKESQTNVEEEVRPNENPLPAEEKEDDCSGPRVVIGENGEIIIDEASLVVRRKENEYQSSSALVENDNTTYTSFRKLVTNKWTLRETIKFYQALVMVGTDFALMELIFKNNWKISKSRHQLKLKYKLEERHNSKFVYRAMYESSTWDESILQDNSDDMSDSSEVDEPSINQNNVQSDEVEKKETDTIEKTAVDNDPMVVTNEKKQR